MLGQIEDKLERDLAQRENISEAPEKTAILSDSRGEPDKPRSKTTAIFRQILTARASRLILLIGTKSLTKMRVNLRMRDFLWDYKNA